jgi:hypothetical protein
MANNQKVQVQLAQSSGGGQIPIDQIGGTAGVTSIESLDGAVSVVSPDASITVGVSGTHILQLSTPAVGEAQNAQATADGAVAVNVTQNTRLDALELAVIPKFADEVFRARAKELAGITAAGSRFYYTDDLELDGWKFFQGAHPGNENPSVVNLDDNSSTTPNNVYPGATATLGARVGKWMISAIVRFFGTVNVGSGEWRALVGTDHQDTFANAFGVGLFENVDPTHFSFFAHGGDRGDKSVVSTIPYSAGTHKVELWYDGTNYFFSIDEEPPINLTAGFSIIPVDFPDGGMSLVFTNKNASQKTFVDAIGYATTRTNAGP